MSGEEDWAAFGGGQDGDHDDNGEDDGFGDFGGDDGFGDFGAFEEVEKKPKEETKEAPEVDADELDKELQEFIEDSESISIDKSMEKSVDKSVDRSADKSKVSSGVSVDKIDKELAEFVNETSDSDVGDVCVPSSSQTPEQISMAKVGDDAFAGDDGNQTQKEEPAKVVTEYREKPDTEKVEDLKQTATQVLQQDEDDGFGDFGAFPDDVDKEDDDEDDGFGDFG